MFTLVKTLNRIAVLVITTLILAFPALAHAENAPAIPKRLEELPSVGQTFELGYGDVTGLTCIGESQATGRIVFDAHFDDTYGFFGGEYNLSGLQCIDPDLGALGGGYGTQTWPIEWVGAPTRFKAFAEVSAINAVNCTVTYRITAYAVRNDGVNEYTDPYQTGFQRMWGEFVIPYSAGGYAELKKVSAAPSCTTDNPMYSLAGAVYGLYASDADATADTNRLFTFTTKEDGSTNRTDWIETGAYYIKELVASKGYKLDETIHEVSLVGGVNIFEVEEKPYSDPPLLTKSLGGCSYGFVNNFSRKYQ